MRLTICVWMLCSRGRSPTEQSPDRAKENERKFTRDKPSQADRRAFRAYSHRCPSRFHSGKLDNRLAKARVDIVPQQTNMRPFRRCVSDRPTWCCTFEDVGTAIPRLRRLQDLFHLDLRLART